MQYLGFWNRQPQDIFLSGIFGGTFDLVCWDYIYGLLIFCCLAYCLKYIYSLQIMFSRAYPMSYLVWHATNGTVCIYNSYCNSKLLWLLFQIITTHRRVKLNTVTRILALSSPFLSSRLVPNGKVPGSLQTEGLSPLKYNSAK